MPRAKPEKFDPIYVGKFHLLNVTKVRTAIETLERHGKEVNQENLLPEYDKLGGAIMKEGRKIETGAFYDFLEKQPKKIENYDTLGEEDFADEYVLVRKKKQPEGKKLTHKDIMAKIKKEKVGEMEEQHEEPRKPGRPKKVIEEPRIEESNIE